MNYDVVITSQAEREAQTNHDWWAANRSAEQAARWYDAFVAATLSLRQNPDRCPPASENGRFPYEIRQINFGAANKPTRRLLYTVGQQEVVILRVRHLAQQEI